MNITELKELIESIDKSAIDVLKLEKDELTLFFQKSGATSNFAENGVQPENATPKVEAINESEQSSVMEDDGFHQIKSPMVGTFYLRSNPDAEPFVEVGSFVQKNQPVCVLEAMKLFNEVVSDVDGEIVEIAAEDGQLIEFGQPLFIVKVSG